MGIKVRIASILQQYTEDQEFIEVTGNTIYECLDDLVKRFPDTRKWIFNDNNSPLVWVLLNKEVVLPGDLNKEITVGDEIDLVPMVAGG